MLITARGPFTTTTIRNVGGRVRKTNGRLILLRGCARGTRLLSTIGSISTVVVHSSGTSTRILSTTGGLGVVIHTNTNCSGVSLTTTATRGMMTRGAPNRGSGTITRLMFNLLMFTIHGFCGNGTNYRLGNGGLNVLTFNGINHGITHVTGNFNVRISTCSTFYPTSIVRTTNIRTIGSRSRLFRAYSVISLRVPTAPRAVGDVSCGAIGRLPGNNVLVGATHGRIVGRPRLLGLLTRHRSLGFVASVGPSTSTSFTGFRNHCFSAPGGVNTRATRTGVGTNVTTTGRVGTFFTSNYAGFRMGGWLFVPGV